MPSNICRDIIIFPHYIEIKVHLDKKNFVWQTCNLTFDDVMIAKRFDNLFLHLHSIDNLKYLLHN